MMAVKISVALPLLLLISLNGVCPQTPREVYVKVGEMVALQCPYYRKYTHGDARLIWTSHIFQKIYPSSNTSSAEQMGVLVHGRSLVILSASVNHQGNYSCSLGNGSRQFWFRLMVYAAHNKNYEAKTTYSLTCYTHESCTLKCPDVNTPAVNILNITSYGVIWTKVGESLPKADYISSVEETDHGVYTCTRSYLYYGQIYNMTFTVALDVQPGKKVGEAVILSPHGNEVFDADLGSTLVIDCKAVMYSDFDEVFWLIEESFVDTDSNLPVFYNYTRDSNTNEIKMTASLVFKKVSVEDLSKHYTCKLDTDNQPSRSVTVTLAKKASSFFSMALGIGIITVVVTLLAAVICITLKMDLFRRDTYACYRSVSGFRVHADKPNSPLSCFLI